MNKYITEEEIQLANKQMIRWNYFLPCKVEKQSSKTIMRTPSPGKNEGKHPVSYMVNRNVFGNQVLKLLNKKKYVLVQQIHLGNANDRNKSTRMYKLWYKVYYSSACKCQKTTTTNKI